MVVEIVVELRSLKYPIYGITASVCFLKVIGVAFMVQINSRKYVEIFPRAQRIIYLRN